MRHRHSSLLLILIGISSSGPLRAQETGVALVAQLYREFAWEVVVEEPMWRGHAFIEQPRVALARYLDSSLTTLLLADRECERRTQGICNLDFDPIWDSQDPGATGLKVTGTRDPTVVSVRFRQFPTGNEVALSFHVVHTQAGWRVHDVRYPNGSSLLGILSRAHQR
jgi:hypothetical protein